jgi:Stage II sporulation protein E (SpoIIE)
MPHSLGHMIATGWKLPILVIVVYGVMIFLYEKTKARLERRNVELQTMVQAGAARLEIQNEELQRAREIQESLLPKQIPQLPGFEVASAWQPARAVGGDYFDVLKLGESRLALCIADVSGKGVPAALLMANVQASLRASVRDLDSPACVCGIINGMLCESIAAGKFVTCFCSVWTPPHTPFATAMPAIRIPFWFPPALCARWTRAARCSAFFPPGRIRTCARISALATGYFYLPTALPKPRGRMAKNSAWKKLPHSPKRMRRMPRRGRISSCWRR